MRTYKVGLLGAGFISDHHAKAIGRIGNARVDAICDLNRGAAEELAARHGIANVYESLDEMLKSDLDAVHVLAPPDAHLSLARKILDAGINVMLEKPMGVGADACHELADYASQKGLKAAVNHNFLFTPAYEKMRKDLKAGEIGMPNHLTVNWFYPLPMLSHGPYHIWMLRDPGNLMLELGSHLCSFALDILGEAEEVSVHASRPITLPTGITVPRKWTVEIENTSSSATLNLSSLPGFTDRSLSVQGHGAVAHCDYERNTYVIDRATPKDPVFHNFSSTLSLGRQYLRQAGGNFMTNVAGTLLKNTDANPFEQSMFGSISAFYRGLDQEKLDERIEAAFGARVIELCERNVARANLPGEYTSSRQLGVRPLGAKPDVLVLGGTGFIGRQLVRQLSARGEKVRVVTRNTRSGDIALDEVNAELAEGSLKDPDFLDASLDGIKTVYHLARAVGDNWNDYYENDVQVTRNIAERSVKAGVNRFIYTGTIDSYYSGDPNETVRGSTPLDPNIKTRNFYGRSKAACEELLGEMAKAGDLPLSIFRPGIVIGDGCSPWHWGVGMWWSDSLMQYWGNGENKLPFVLVEDVADGLVRAMDTEACIGNSYLLVDKPMMSARDYIDACSTASGTRIQTRNAPTYRNFINDALKNAAKYAIHHPNRAVPSYRDWKSRSHLCTYDATETEADLGWQACGTAEGIIERGIALPVSQTLR